MMSRSLILPNDTFLISRLNGSHLPNRRTGDEQNVSHRIALGDPCEIARHVPIYCPANVRMLANFVRKSSR
jgi:hypothetical protein